MKIPQKPIDVHSLLKKQSSEVFKLLKNNEILEFVSWCNKEYIHWDELRYKKIPGDIDPRYIWARMTIFRENQYLRLQFSNWTFQYLLLDEFQKKLHFLDKGAAGVLGSNLDAVNLEGRERYIISSLMEEAIASSQIEGAAATRKVAKETLRLKKKPKTYSEQMIVNSYNPIQKIVRMKERTITAENILEISEIMTTYGVAYDTARKDLLNLSQHGYLEKIKVQKNLSLGCQRKI